jgi:N-acetylneuraminic acid mutarotase
MPLRRRVRRVVHVDPLDRRTLMCNEPAHLAMMATVGTEVAPGFAVVVDFAWLNSPTVPGTQKDGGRVYGSRGNGYTFGWNVDSISAGRDRNVHPDQRYDAFIKTMSGANRSWEIAVPNGTYSVKLVAGDPSFNDAVYRYNLEGQPALSGTPTKSNRFIESTTRVTVNDGRLTLTNGTGAVNNNIAFIEITSDNVVPPPPPPPPPPVVGWTRGTNMPVAMAEVASAVVGDRLFVIGSNDASTLAYDITNKQWLPTATYAPRPFFGDHHGIEVLDGKLYVIGGLLSAAGKVQIFDPVANVWSIGADMPWDGGSVSTAMIGGKIYAAGGVIGSTATNYQGTGSTNQAAVYDPAANTWTSIAPMPQGRHHTAAATDGTRFWIFGGRVGQNVLANGTSDVQVYDPATNMWTTNLTSTTLKAMPFPRSGMGKAAYLNGEFYVMGGETLNGAGAVKQVYSRVDIYTSLTNAWRTGPNMLTGRHGLFPVVIGSQIWVAGGGDKVGVSASALLEILST